MALAAVVAGAQIFAANMNQFRDLLTGVMTDQPVTLANTLGVGYGPSRTTEIKMYNSGTVTEWSTRQIQHNAGDPTSDNWRLARLVGGIYTEVMHAYPSGGVFIGTSPADPSANNLRVQGTLLVGTNGLKTYASGGVFIGSSPADPNAGNLDVSGIIQAGPLSSNALQLVGNAGNAPVTLQAVSPGGNTGVQLDLAPWGPATVNFNYSGALVTGHTSSAAKQLWIRVLGTDYYIPLNT